MASELETERVEDKRSSEAVRSFLAHAAKAFAGKPFTPHRAFTKGHAQTLAAYAWPRRRRLQTVADEERFFQVAENTEVLAHCRWQERRTEHPTIVIWHGIEGSSGGVYMLSTARKAFAAGFNVVRMNLRNCGDTEHLTPTIYHGGLSEDLRVVVTELIERDRLKTLFLIGFSLGGNMVLKLAGEYADNAPVEVSGICAVSPSVDLQASTNAISQRSNWLYHRDFMRRLRQRIRFKKKLFPELYDIRGLSNVRTIKDFDDRYTSRAHGFANADDYYYKASAIRVIDRVRIPTLIIHGQDDPFTPFAPLLHPAIADNPYILLLAPEGGGHVAFLAAETNQEDRFWAENRVVEFCQLACQNREA